MAPIELRDIRQGRRESRLRLLAPLRYLWISHPEKGKYDLVIPAFLSLALWAGYMFVQPKPMIFGDAGVLRYTRDLLVMAVPFMIGALAAVAMGAPQGLQLDRRPPGADIVLDDEILTLRQFVCYLLGYLCFLAMVTLVASVSAELFRPIVLAWTVGHAVLRATARSAGAFFLSGLLSALMVTVLWALYFLTDILNRRMPNA